MEWTYLALLVWLAIAGPGKLSLEGLRKRFTMPPPHALTSAVA